MADDYLYRSVDLDSPADRHQQITPSDADAVDPKPRSLWCQTAGDLVLKDRDGTELTYTVSQGQIIPFRATYVMAATTATVYGWD